MFFVSVLWKQNVFNILDKVPLVVTPVTMLQLIVTYLQYEQKNVVVTETCNY